MFLKLAADIPTEICPLAVICVYRFRYNNFHSISPTVSAVSTPVVSVSPSPYPEEEEEAECEDPDQQDTASIGSDTTMILQPVSIHVHM